jgi:hypothetical protein
MAGASGALYALFACQSTVAPDSRFAIILLPFFTFPASQMLALAMSVDVAGLLFGWRMFDHGAHLVRRRSTRFSFIYSRTLRPVATDALGACGGTGGRGNGHWLRVVGVSVRRALPESSGGEVARAAQAVAGLRWRR